MKHTKIVCTIGPASNTTATLKKMISAGMNVARLNFSHGDYKDHAKLIATIRDAAKEKGQYIALLQDLQGPRIRIGDVSKEGVLLEHKGDVVLMSQADFDARDLAKSVALPVQYENLYQDVSVGATILIQDGTIELRVENIEGTHIHCSVVQEGTVFSHKGINTPGSTITTSVITEKDKADVAFGVEQDVDYIALSFVKNAADIHELRALLPTDSKIKIIAKIERQEAVKNFAEILAAVDGIMVARGDLGVELGPEKVPLLQKKLVLECVKVGKPVIVATQMLESMINNPRPTRAEAADVANAILDHADAIMLSAESAAGKFPVEAIRTMTAIAHEVEGSEFAGLDPALVAEFTQTQNQGVADAAIRIAEASQAKAVVVLVHTGSTARLISQLRPQNLQIVACTFDERVLRQMALVWGVQGVMIEQPKGMDELMTSIRTALPTHGIAKEGDTIVLVTGHNAQFDNARKGLKSVETVII